MSLKVVSRMAIGGVCLAAAAFGAGRCSTETKNVDNILEEDTVEISKPTAETKEELPQISYERNFKLNKRFDLDAEDVDHFFEQYGTYGASIYGQAILETQIDPFYPVAQAVQIGADMIEHKIDKDIDNGLYDEFNIHPQLKDMYALSELSEQCKKAEHEYSIYIRDMMDKYLVNDGAPSLDKCNSYIRKMITESFKHLPADERAEEVANLLADFENFKAAQGKPTVKKQAELLAYQQYKLDSIASAQILQESGAGASNTIWDAFETLYKNYQGKPKP